MRRGILKRLFTVKGFLGNWNENCLVIMVTEGAEKILLMGDVLARVEELLVKEHGDGLRADILKVGHHAAADATSADFLEAVRPTWAVISINKDNIRGYPSDGIIQRLENRAVMVYKTFEDGDIRFSGGWGVSGSDESVARANSGKKPCKSPQGIRPGF